MTPAIEVQNLFKDYGRRRALNGLQLQVPEGTIFGLVGPNGAGKTTLIKLLIGALRANAGSIKVLGLDPIKDKWVLRKQIGYMPQAAALYDDLSAKNNILFFGSAHQVAGLAQKADELLGFAGLTERADDLVRNFSGGMKKRVSLCCALVHQPKIVFLDEPTAAIDPQLKLQSWRLFRQLAQSGITLIVSTHMMEEALLCDQVSILINGEIIAVDTPAKILERGKTRLIISSTGYKTETQIDSTPESMAEALKQLGLNRDILSISTQPDTLEQIILNIIAEKEKQVLS